MNAQHINTPTLFQNIEVDHLIVASDINLHSWVVICIEI